MSDYSLVARSALGGFSREINNTRIEEVTGMSIVSMAVPRGGKTALIEAMQKHYGAAFPDPGRSTLASDQSVRFLNMAVDQLFALFAHRSDDGDIVLSTRLGNKAYYTLQSDNWLLVRISGPLAIATLHRICQIDLATSSFPVNAVARTLMEHTSATLIREDQDCFLLMSPWSSANSFVHALETCLTNATQTTS